MKDVIPICEMFASSLFFALAEFLFHKYSHISHERHHARHHQGLRDHRKWPAFGLLAVFSCFAYSTNNLHIEAVVAGLVYRVALFTLLHELFHSDIKLPPALDRLRERHHLHHKHPVVNLGTSMRYLDWVFSTEGAKRKAVSA